MQSLYQQRIQDLVAEVDPKQMLDDDVEDVCTPAALLLHYLIDRGVGGGGVRW